MTLKNQRGSISYLGGLAIMLSVIGLYSVLALGDKMIKKAQFDAYAQAIAPELMRTELAITKEMIDNGSYITPRKKAEYLLSQVGLDSSEVDIKIIFGNINEDGSKFDAVETNPQNPKKDIKEVKNIPQFNAVSVELIDLQPAIFRKFFSDIEVKGRALYGLSKEEEEGPEMGSCFCDVRYSACLYAEKSDSVMGDPVISSDQDDSQHRKRMQYCETGYSPALRDKGIAKLLNIPTDMFLSSYVPKYGFNADTVAFSPQWVGVKPPNNQQAEAEAEAWKAINNDNLIKVDFKFSWSPFRYYANNPFSPGWDPKQGKWNSVQTPILITLFEDLGLDDMLPWKLQARIKELWAFISDSEDKFYVGRKLTCVPYPETDSKIVELFKNIKKGLDNIASKVSGNTRCLRYKTDPNEYATKYKFAGNALQFLEEASDVNERYYSCYDFSGIKSARNGWQQVLFRLATKNLTKTNEAYEGTQCAIQPMHYFDPSIQD